MTKKKVQNLLKHLVCILLCLTVILPFYMVVINSFKSKGEASRMSLAMPKEWLFSNYTEVIDKGNLIQGFSNSLLYALVATTFGVVLCAMAAFVMCRKRIKHSSSERYATGNYYGVYKRHDSVLCVYYPQLCGFRSGGAGRGSSH